jgi:AhpC/TSA antioxidant enzyme
MATPLSFYTSLAMDSRFKIWQTTQCQRVSDGEIVGILDGCESKNHLLAIALPQLGDFDSLEYIWWLRHRLPENLATKLTIRGVGIGDRRSGQKFCEFTGFPESWLFVDPDAKLHQSLGLYQGLTFKLPLLSSGQNAWLNLMLMCAGIGSSGTLAEVLRGYTGDRHAPQLIGEEETITAIPKILSFKGSFFNLAGGKGFQRPFELATLRLRNMSEVLTNWSVYVPNAAYLTQRGGTFLFAPDFINDGRNILYKHCDRGILGFAENMSQPLTFLDKILFHP